MRDINEKYKIRNEDLLDSLTNFMMDNISNITSIRNITNSLKRADDTLNHKTIGSYIQYLCNAFLFYKVRRYDIQGKRYLESQDKYYLVDPTFKYAKLGMKNMNYGRNYENIVAIELLRRGYEIYVGELYNCEVDFVAMKRDEKLYIQVSDNIDDEKQLQKSILGVEKKPLPHMLCTTNLILHNIDNPQIKHDNSLGYPVKDIKPKDKVDIILTNPPFGGIEEDGIEDNFPANYKTKETADLFLVLLMYKLKQTGRAAIVLPDGFLFGEGVKTAIKEKLLSEFNLHTIVRLPNGVFAPYTGINTNLLFLERGTTQEIWFYEHQLPEGYKNYTKTKPIKLEEFEAEKAWWNARKETDCAWKVSIDEVKARGYNLDFKNPSTQLEQSIPSPEEVIRKTSDCLTRSRQILLEIEELLK